MLMAGIVDQIKERLDIVDLISSYLKLQKSGINYKARCPFHNEKSGSFFVSPERQIWHCFGCGLGGDAFGFVKQIEGVEFPDALRTLAARAGVKLERQSPEYQEYQSAKTKLYEICELAMRFFEKQLHQSSTGRQAFAYLKDRGLTDESIKEFHLGYAPESWNALYDFLNRNYESVEALGAGMIIKKDGGGYYDRFRSRIMFPIFDINRQVVGFTGRVFGELAKQEGVGKYMNSPQTAIYDKSRVLYGLDQSKLEIRRSNHCLVVEGNMDVIMSHQAGVKHAVASSGTALTGGHLKIIKRYTDNLDLCFDADSAGSLATDRGVDLALAKGFNVGIITIRENDLKDPADYVKKYGAKWSEYTQKSKPFMDFYFETTKSTFDLATALGKKLFSQKLMPFLASIGNRVEQAHWVSEMALVLKTKEEILYQELASIKPRDEEAVEVIGASLAAAGSNSTVSLDSQEEVLLSLIIKKPQLVVKIRPEDEGFFSIQFKDISGKINMEQKEPPIAQLVSTAEPALTMSLEFAFLKSQEMWKDFPDHELDEEFDKLIRQIKKRKLSAQLASLEYDIRSAEKEKNKERLAVLVAEFSKISKQL
ncbi:MAG: DNA primase [Candidatus Yanofskybacteria bacterium RIFCSPHIGHO2_01_FULL_44_17]|uniref:DNA primase n=1 Tax=Candidatus Yanofskybacteria bacterium RIFCSPHIGHO2_01_FULL_44_17 TaxID=1802668 RepID=A0A1F8EVQ5_9BACT|nr:MAG: DNA primase [Candidatus Yanofskybacteria bacterium RIFCSPHIGHO2_01_FULL_44_17]